MKRRRAFTLVELMIALGIITLLAALLIPIVAAARRMAVRSRMKADVLAIAQGLEIHRVTSTQSYVGSNFWHSRQGSASGR